MEITDKEVGELWQSSTRPQRHADHDGCDWTIEQLIRKLVEERTQRYKETSHITRMVDELQHALRDFDIPEDQWK